MMMVILNDDDQIVNFRNCLLSSVFSSPQLARRFPIVPVDSSAAKIPGEKNYNFQLLSTIRTRKSSPALDLKIHIRGFWLVKRSECWLLIGRELLHAAAGQNIAHYSKWNDGFHFPSSYLYGSHGLSARKGREGRSQLEVELRNTPWFLVYLWWFADLCPGQQLPWQCRQAPAAAPRRGSWSRSSSRSSVYLWKFYEINIFRWWFFWSRLSSWLIKGVDLKIL